MDLFISNSQKLGLESCTSLFSFISFFFSLSHFFLITTENREIFCATNQSVVQQIAHTFRKVSVSKPNTVKCPAT